VQLRAGQTAFLDGHGWEIGGVGTEYMVYTGFIAELQSLLQGSSSNPSAIPGYIASGTRCRVVPPELYKIDFSISVIMRYGGNVNQVIEQIRFVVQEYMNSLGPGQTMFISDLYSRLKAGVRQAEAFNILSPVGNVSSPNPRISLRAGNVGVI